MGKGVRAPVLANPSCARTIASLEVMGVTTLQPYQGFLGYKTLIKLLSRSNLKRTQYAQRKRISCSWIEES